MNVSEMKNAVHDEISGHEGSGDDHDCYHCCMIGCLGSWHLWDVPHEGLHWTHYGLVTLCSISFFQIVPKPNQYRRKTRKNKGKIEYL